MAGVLQMLILQYRKFVAKLSRNIASPEAEPPQDPQEPAFSHVSSIRSSIGAKGTGEKTGGAY